MALYPTASGLAAIRQYESGGGSDPAGANIYNYRYDPTHTASGYYQITNTLWRSAAPAAGVDLNTYPTAISAPFDVQTQVASTLPISNWTCSGCNSRLAGLFSNDPSLSSGMISGADFSSTTPDASFSTADGTLTATEGASGTGTNSVDASTSGTAIDTSTTWNGAVDPYGNPIYTAPGAPTTQYDPQGNPIPTQAASSGWLASIGDWFQRGGILVLAVLAIVGAIIWLALETKQGQAATAAVARAIA